MPARESKQLRDMHQLLQQLEELHTEHDLEHLGLFEGAREWVSHKINTHKEGNEAKKDSEARSQTKWDGLDEAKKRKILKDLVNFDVSNLIECIIGSIPENDYKVLKKIDKTKKIEWMEAFIDKETLEQINSMQPGFKKKANIYKEWQILVAASG